MNCLPAHSGETELFSADTSSNRIWNGPQTHLAFLWLQWGSAGSHSRRSWFIILFHGRSPPLCNYVSQFLIMFFDPYSDPWWQHATQLFKKEILTDLFCGSAWLLPLVEEFPWWQISQGALSRSMSSSVGFILKTPTMISHLVTRAVQYRIYHILLNCGGKGTVSHSIRLHWLD